MNRSYSKLRHIQESNRILETRRLLIKEQAQETDQSTNAEVETVNDKIYELSLQINTKLKECTALLSGEKKGKFEVRTGFFLKDKGAFCVVTKGGPNSVKFEIANGTSKNAIQVGDFRYLAQKPILSTSFATNVTTPYTTDDLSKKFQRVNGVENSINEFVPSIAPAFSQWLNTFLPSLVEILNTIVFAFPDKPGTATLQEWGTRDIIVGGNVPFKTTT